MRPHSTGLADYPIATRLPVVIGATGGSGTRALRAVLMLYGAYMGEHVSSAGDAWDFSVFYDLWIDATLRHTRSLNYRLDDLPAEVREPALARLRESVSAYCGRFDTGRGPWGFKGPRSMYALPYLHRLLPGMTFLHLIRDGRDMAISRNHGQVRKHYAAVFGEAPGDDLDVAAARLWSKANLEANAWCRANLPDRHMIVRYERLCDQPAETIADILRLLRWPCTQDQLSQLVRAIRPSPGIGRWRSAPKAGMTPIAAACSDSLRTFGYLD